MMTASLFFRLAPGHEPALMVEPSGAVRTATTAETTQHRAICAVPGNEVLLTSVRLPTRKRKQAEKAVPFLLEESLAGTLEEQHFALGAFQENGLLGVAVTARQTLEQWLAQLRQHGLRPAILVAEPLLLPWTPGSWSVAVESHQALVRTSAQEGFSTERENLPTLLTIALRQAGERTPHTLRLFDFSGSFNPATLPPLPGVRIVVEPAQGSALSALLAQGYRKEHTINLLQGPYVHREQWFSLKKHPLRIPMLLLAVWLTLESGLEFTRALHLSQRIEQGETEIMQLFRTAFPEVRRIIDAEAQMRQELKALKGRAEKVGIGFLDLITASGEVLNRSPHAQLLRLGYQDGELDLHFMVDNLEQLNTIKTELQAKPGLRSEIRSAAAEQGKVQCHIKISWNRDEK